MQVTQAQLCFWVFRCNLLQRQLLKHNQCLHTVSNSPSYCVQADSQPQFFILPACKQSATVLYTFCMQTVSHSSLYFLHADSQPQFYTLSACRQSATVLYTFSMQTFNDCYSFAGKQTVSHSSLYFLHADRQRLLFICGQADSQPQFFILSA
jgi:hypothetical protein